MAMRYRGGRVRSATHIHVLIYRAFAWLYTKKRETMRLVKKTGLVNEKRKPNTHRGVKKLDLML